MIDFGTVRPGTTLYIPFAAFDSNDPSASTTISGLATTDIEIYKNGSTTQRASDSGYALLDTDGIDFDGLQGINGFSVDLSDNTTAGFYAAGAQYWVVVSSITVDAATISFIAATFRIGYENALLNTTIAAYTSTDNFTLNGGSADNDAYNGCILVAHDVASAIQVQIGVIEDYTGATKTVNLKADPGIFTMTANDNISIFPPALLPTTAGTTVDVTATGAVGIDWGNVENKTTANDLSATDIQLCDTVTTLTGHTAQTGDNYARLGAPVGASISADIATVDANVDSILADTGTDGVIVATNNDKTGYALSASGVDAVWDEPSVGHVTAGTYGVAVTDTLADTADMQPKLGTPAADVSADIAAVKSDTAAILTDTGTTLDNHLTDIKGTGFAKDTHSLTNIEGYADILDDGTSGNVKIATDVAAVLADTGTDGVVVASVGSGAISSASFAAGAIDSAAVAAGVVGGIDKNAAFSNFMFVMRDSTNHDPATGLTVTATVSIDAAAFGAAAGSVTEVANGVYQFDALAADTNGDVVTWRFSAASADDTFFTFRTIP